MAQYFEYLPDGDVENDGWTLVGGSATTVWEIIGSYEDDCHVRCPVYRGGVEVKFPFDDPTQQLPSGAIIDSVTVFVRMVTNSGSGARGVTINVLSADNRSRYTTRTIYATGSLPGAPDWGVEVGTYTKDPLGRAWDIHRLNKLRLRMFSYNNLADSVRVYGLWVRVNFHTKPSVAITSPSGSVNTPSPNVSWTYTQTDGEPQKNTEYKIFTLTAASAATFNPNTTEVTYQGTTSGIANSFILPTSLNNDSYVIYMRAQSQFGAWSAWANKQFTISAPSPGVPGDNNAGVAGIPGIGTPTVVPDNYTSSSAIRMTDTSNLLSVQQADFEIASDPLGWVANANCTIARDTTQAFADGVASLKLTASSAATMSAKTTHVEVYPGQPMTVRSQFLGAAARSVSLTAQFYDETFTLLGGSITVSGTDATGTWTELKANGTSPADAKYCEVVATVTSPASSEAHYVDHVGLMYGTDTAWSDGGHMSRNMLTAFLATGDSPTGTDTWVSANTATTMSLVAATGTGAHGSQCNQMTCQTVAGTIGFRAAGTTGTSTIFNSTTSGKNFTLYKPTSPSTVQENDLMIAFVTANEFGTITPPSGWTAVNTAAVDDGSTDIAMWILKRTAGNADPASWSTGTISVNATRRSAVVVAYSGAAHADSQFLAEAVRTETAEPKVHKTATIVNTDPNAWRVSAFAASDNVDFTGSSASMVANVTPPSSAGAITYVGKATPWQSTSVSSTITLNKPSGVQNGDLMLGAVVISGNVTASQPAISGWTAVQKIVKTTGNGDDHSGAVTTMIYKRTAGSSESNSWSGTISGFAGQPKISQVVAYRNCEVASNQFIDTASSTALNGSTIGTGTATNNDSKAWRVEIFGATTALASGWLETDKRRTTDTTNLSGHPDTVLSFQDSNGMISTGSHSRTARMDYSDSYFAATGWIGILKPLASPPAAGANESERVEFELGSSPTWTNIGVYDSNAGASLGQNSVYGIVTTGDSSGTNAMASWIGLIKPNTSVAGGVVAAKPSAMIDIDAVPEEVISLAGNKLTVMADFKGSAAGTPTLTAEFYRANQLIGTQSAPGRAFDTAGFTKSWAVFDIPDGTTRIRPVLSALDRAVADTVQFDRVAVMLGALTDPTQEPQWRNGTSRSEHPVWARPVIQYQENDGTGYGEWKLLAGQKALPPAYDLNTSQMFYVDHTIVPLNSRRYRVATESYGLNGDFFSSGYGPASQEAIFEPRAWWLKDIQDLSKNIQISVRWKDMQVDTANMATAFQPIGADFPVVVTEGFKGDSFGLEIHCEQAEFTSLMKLLNSGRTLILQSDIDKMWWVRPVGNIQANILATGSRQERPRRYVSVTFMQVAPEE